MFTLYHYKSRDTWPFPVPDPTYVLVTEWTNVQSHILKGTEGKKKTSMNGREDFNRKESWKLHLYFGPKILTECKKCKKAYLLKLHSFSKMFPHMILGEIQVPRLQTRDMHCTFINTNCHHVRTNYVVEPSSARWNRDSHRIQVSKLELY